MFDYLLRLYGIMKEAGEDGGGNPPPEKKPEDMSITEEGESITLQLPENYFDDTPGEDADKDNSLDKDKDNELPEGVSLKFTAKYGKMTRKDLLAVIHNQESMIGRQATQIGLERLKNKPPTAENIETAMDEALADIEKLTGELAALDPLDDRDKYKTTKEALDKAKSDKDALRKAFKDALTHQTKTENLKTQAAEIANTERDLLKSKFKAEFPDNHWAEVVSEAQKLAGDDAVTKDDIHAAMIRLMGHELYSKMLIGTAKTQVREDIRNAGDKVVKTIGNETKGKVGHNIDDLSYEQIQRLLTDSKTPQVVKDALYKKYGTGRFKKR